jgi:hypothetical protein
MPRMPHRPADRREAAVRGARAIPEATGWTKLWTGLAVDPAVMRTDLLRVLA